MIIPWGALAREPSSWIASECTPANFEWKDPSKIRIVEACCLLEHWRGCISHGLAGIIWVPTSPLLGDQDDVPLDVPNREWHL